MNATRLATAHLVLVLATALGPPARAATTTLVIENTSRNMSPTNSNLRANKLTLNANDPYAAATWTNSLDTPTKQAIATKIESMGGGGTGAPVGTMVNTGSATIGALPRATDTTGTNYVPSSVLATGSTLAAGTLTESGNAVPNATDPLSFFAATTSAQLSGVLSDETGSGLAVFATSPTLTTPAITGAITFPDGIRQTFNPNGTTPGVSVGSQAGDPSTPANGDLWYDSTGNLLRARINGSSVSLGAGGTSANWVASGTTNSTLSGNAFAYSGTFTNSLNLGVVGTPALFTFDAGVTFTNGGSSVLLTNAIEVLQLSNFTARASFALNTATVNDLAYDATTWDGSTNVPTRNAIRDKIESMAGGGSATNAIATISSNGVNIATGVTNLNIAGLKLLTNVSGNVTLDFANIATTSIEVSIGDGTNVVGAGIVAYIEVPFDCTITRSTLVADASGSTVLDIWKDTYANYPPVVGDTITASAKPTLSSAIKSQDSTLTGWTTTVAAGDWLAINVDSATTVKRLTLSLRVLKK